MSAADHRARVRRHGWQFSVLSWSSAIGLHVGAPPLACSILLVIALVPFGFALLHAVAHVAAFKREQRDNGKPPR